MHFNVIKEAKEVGRISFFNYWPPSRVLLFNHMWSIFVPASYGAFRRSPNDVGCKVLNYLCINPIAQANVV